MNSHDPASSIPPRLPLDRDPGDAWVEAPTGERYWGRFGAAGLLAHDACRGVLLQHRALWSHHGGTWGIPGGALLSGEQPAAGALREAGEEAGVPADALVPFATSVVDRDVWRYTTVLARVERPFVPVAGDAESLELAWVPLPQVDELELHPGFREAWPHLLRMLTTRPALIVDAANVVGSRPDGWWKDRAGATERLGRSLSAVARGGVPAAELGLEGATWQVPIELVVEGAARAAEVDRAITVTAALRDGDSTIVERARRRIGDGETVVVVTSDRELTHRVEALGAVVRGARWLLAQVESASETEPVS